jgi:hypothetical protein
MSNRKDQDRIAPQGDAAAPAMPAVDAARLRAAGEGKPEGATGGGHGIASGHNPGGALPGGGPGAGLGSLGTGGGSTGGAPTGSVKRGGK